MQSYSLTHLADHAVDAGLTTVVKRNRVTTAEMLAYIAESDERKRYLPAAYPSMLAYCVGEQHMSEDEALTRIWVARTARQFPVLFAAVADGRLNLTGVRRLARHLTPETVDELVAAAAHKREPEIERLLAERFPRPEVATVVQAITQPVATDVQPVSKQVDPSSESPRGDLVLEPPDPAIESRTYARIAPLSPDRFALQGTVDREVNDFLDYAKALLGHAVPSGDLFTVLKRTLAEGVERLEQKKFGKAARTRPRRSSPNGRYVPRDIRRTVWQRDGGQCTFVSEAGKRCPACSPLEFDHIEPVARDGQATVANLRLRCRAHNQYAAECTLGAGFMARKRQEARDRAAHRKEKAKARSEVSATAASESDVIPWLRRLGFSVAEARQGAARCAHLSDAPLDQRVRVALQALAPPCVRHAAPVASPS